MRCISPLLIRTAKSRNTVPCGRCNFCLSNKRADWSFRLLQELKVADTAHFLTLTYDESNVPYNPLSGLPELRKSDYQCFVKSLRKTQPAQIRYYAVGEYGTKTQRPHYHAIMFNLANQTANNLDRYWSHGLHHVGSVEMASIHYVTKYVINRLGEYTGREPPFALMSRRPGIGINYLNTHKNYHLYGKNTGAKINGQNTRLPRYYKDKIWSKVARETLSAEMLAAGDAAYIEAITALSEFNPDPAAALDERLAFAHSQIITKSNQFDTL